MISAVSYSHLNQARRHLLLENINIYLNNAISQVRKITQLQTNNRSEEATALQLRESLLQNILHTVLQLELGSFLK